MVLGLGICESSDRLGQIMCCCDSFLFIFLRKRLIVSMQFLMSTGAKEVKNNYNQILRKLVKAFPRLSLIL